jgi:integrase
MKITKSFVDKAAVPTDKDQTFYRDDELKGFALRVTAGGIKSFVVETLIERKVRRITLGKYGALTAEQARKEAKSLLGKIARGENPIAEKKEKAIKHITLRQAFNDYLAARKSLKESTTKDYEGVLKQVVPDWLNKPLINISKELIQRRHARHGENNSKARANYAMRLLRAIFNFAIHQYQSEDGIQVFTTNPVKSLSHARSWYRIARRQTIVKNHELADWYRGLNRLSESYSKHDAAMWQDYFLLVLFTGMRRSETASIRWNNVDLIAKTFTLHDTKNRDSHTLPMSDFIYDLFLRRRQATVNSEFVFPANSETGHIIEPRKAMLNLVELSGVEFTIHDLRRTFITTAESLDISAYALKRLLNHKMNNDVTSGYLIIDVERLRKPMQQITNYLLKCMEIKESDVHFLKTEHA